MGVFTNLLYLIQIWYPFFKHNNRVDSQNLSCNYGLSIEKLYLTTNAYFQIITVLFSIVITKYWEGYLCRIEPISKYKNIFKKLF